MKKRLLVFSFVIIILFLSVSFVSAGLLDDIGKWFKGVFKGGITGKTSHNVTSTCSDTDGNNYYTKGTVTWDHSNGSSQTFIDYCDSSTKLAENYCSGDTPSTEYFTCNLTCSDGDCVTGDALVCIELGKSSYVKGNCTDNLGRIYYDYCNGNISMDYFCQSNGSCRADGHTCPNACSDGVCIQVTSTENNQTNTSTTTTQSSSTSTTSSGSGGGGGGGSGGGGGGGYYIPPTDSEYKSKETTTFIDDQGREVTIRTKTETKNGKTEIEEIRSFIDKNGNRIEIKTEIVIESSEGGTEVTRKIKTKDGSEIIFKTKTEVKDGKERVIESVKVKGAEFITKLPIEEKFEEGETKLKAKLSTGFVQEISARPDEALQTALEEIGSTNNFKFELDEVGEGDEIMAVFVAKADRTGKFLGIFNIDLSLETIIDSQTGEIIETKRPWWSFLVVGESKAIICHISEDSNKVTLEIAIPAVKAHLAHGDSIGECVAETPSQPIINNTNQTGNNQPVINGTNQTV